MKGGSSLLAEQETVDLRTYKKSKASSTFFSRRGRSGGERKSRTRGAALIWKKEGYLITAVLEEGEGEEKKPAVLFPFLFLQHGKKVKLEVLKIVVFSRPKRGGGGRGVYFLFPFLEIKGGKKVFASQEKPCILP